MKNSTLVFLIFLLLASCEQRQEPISTEAATPKEQLAPKYAIVIHGGAGTIKPGDISPEQDSSYRAALNTALDIGEHILELGGSALDAVEHTIQYMENSPLFNSGKGAVFTHEGRNELDASIMNGADRSAGAVGGVTIVKNPISAARAVMEKSKHVLLVGKGAEEFATEQGLEIVNPSYFYTEDRWNRLQSALDNEYNVSDEKKGTVGCVALDKNGHIAAGTSTGGMTNKRWNRIGDSPIIGAGTFADDATCGVSCTGHGEYFIRWSVAYDVSARIAYQGVSLEDAADEIINHVLVNVKALGGLVALDRYGNITMPFNTSGMYRGYAKPGERVVKIFKE